MLELRLLGIKEQCWLFAPGQEQVSRVAISRMMDEETRIRMKNRISSMKIENGSSEAAKWTRVTNQALKSCQ